MKIKNIGVERAGKILIVDDNLKNLQVLGSVLKQQGYPLEFATNGQQALNWVEKETFDVILLDVMMPGMDGFEVCEIIRANESLAWTPIIFLTAKSDSESVVKGFEIGAQDYVSKPFNTTELLMRVKTQVDLTTSKRNLEQANKKLEEKVEERTKDLQKAHDALLNSEEQLQFALDASSEGIWDRDMELETISFSPALYTMLGYEPYAFPQDNKEIRNRMHPDDFEGRDAPDYFDILRSNPSTFIQDEYRLQKKDGTYIWVRIRGKVVKRDSENRIVRMVGTYTNITSEKHKQRDIIEAILRSENDQRSKISKEIHDGLQQLLTICAMNFDYVKREVDQLGEKAQEQFTVGREYLQKSIVDSRVLAHTLMPRAIVDYGLVSATESLIGLFKAEVPNVEFVIHDNFGTDRLENQQIEMMLYRVLQEIIGYTVLHAEAGLIDVQIKKYDDLIMLTVDDNGKGNVSDSNKDEISLGVDNIRRFLGVYDGTFEIESRPGKGTTYIVRIERDPELAIA